jgi:putative phosphoesterase
MQILVISDTHITNPGKFPTPLIEKARTVDCIIHAGDFTGVQVYEFLMTLGHLEAVRGNSDEPALRGCLPMKRVVELDGIRIGVIHGHGAPFGMARRALSEFQDVQAVVFGHAHKPIQETINGILTINPGSPTTNRFQTSNTYGMLTVSNGVVTGEICELPTTKVSR